MCLGVEGGILFVNRWMQFIRNLGNDIAVSRILRKKQIFVQMFIPLQGEFSSHPGTFDVSPYTLYRKYITLSLPLA